MACHLKCGERTLYRRFGRVIKEGRLMALSLMALMSARKTSAQYGAQ